jgi:hypothetical protein
LLSGLASVSPHLHLNTFRFSAKARRTVHSNVMLRPQAWQVTLSVGVTAIFAMEANLRAGEGLGNGVALTGRCMGTKRAFLRLRGTFGHPNWNLSAVPEYSSA